VHEEEKMQKESRREFLKKAAVGAAALSVRGRHSRCCAERPRDQDRHAKGGSPDGIRSQG